MENYKKTISAVLIGISIGLIPTYGLIIDKLTGKALNVYKSIYFLNNFLTAIGGVLMTEFILFAVAGAIVTHFNKTRSVLALLVTSFLVNYIAYIIKAIIFNWNINLFDLNIIFTWVLFFAYMWIGGFVYSRFQRKVFAI